MAGGHEVAVVVSQPDRRRSRGPATSASPVKRCALDLGLPVGERVDEVIGAGAELGVVVAFGRLVKPDVLARVPMVNLHLSLLPRWRGAAPVERAILAGDRETGVCVMALEEGLDTGPVYARRSVVIGPDESAAELRDRLIDLGTPLLLDCLAGGRSGLPTPVAQEGEATYAAKIEPGERRLEWAREAVALHRLVRIGRAWTTWRGRRLMVARAALAEPVPLAPGHLEGTVVATASGGLELIEVQPEGRHLVGAAEWVRGARPRPDEVLGA